MICASAGNTARAFTHFCAEDNFPLIVVVADIHAHRIWVRKGMEIDSVKVVVVKDGTYQDAKDVAKNLEIPRGMATRRGAHNIARRDGIGSLILDSYEKIGRLPDHYFQAVGGGQDQSEFKMMQRLIDSGHYGEKLQRFTYHKTPNSSPIHNAWQRKISRFQFR